MNIVMVASVFAPEPLVSAQANSHIAEALVQEGHSLHVFAPFPNRPSARLFPGYKRRLYESALTQGGYKLTHCFSTISRRSTMLSRLTENVSFAITVVIRLLLEPRPDAIYSHAWPIFATGAVACIARLRRIPLVLCVVDVYPESMESQKRISKDGLVFKSLRKVDQFASHSASAMIFISRGFRRLYASDRGVDNAHLHVVDYWNSDEMFEPDPAGATKLRRELKIPDGVFIAACAGNIGKACNAEMLVEAFARLKGHENLCLLIAGDGSQLETCRQLAAEKQLARVVIHSPWKSEETGPLLQMADVLLLPTNGNQSNYSIPSKLIGYFMSAKPVIAAVLPGSDTAAVMKESGSGWVVAPDDVDGMAKILLEASQKPRGELNAMGGKARYFALRQFTKSSNLPRVIKIICDVASKTANAAYPNPCKDAVD